MLPAMYQYSYSSYATYFALGVLIGWGLGWLVGPRPPGPIGSGT
jgi:hypothetical protein